MVAASFSSSSPPLFPCADVSENEEEEADADADAVGYPALLLARGGGVTAVAPGLLLADEVVWCRVLRSGLREPSGRKLRVGMSKTCFAFSSYAWAAASSAAKQPRYWRKPPPLISTFHRPLIHVTPR
jgi:hypothetical protein